MNLDAVMQQVGDQLDTIAGLRVFAFPPDKVDPPAAIVSYPESIAYDLTKARGSDRVTLPVVVVVGKVSDRATRDTIAGYVAGAGASSVKAVLEAGTYTAFHTIRVTSVEFDVITIAAVDYLAALFDVDISGSGNG